MMSDYALTRSARDKSDNVGRILVVAYLILFLCFMIFPLFALMSKSMQNADGAFVGVLENHILAVLLLHDKLCQHFNNTP